MDKITEEERLELLQKIIFEDNKIEFNYKDMDCIILRHTWSLHLCGYVKIPDTHGLYEMHCNDIPNIDVHWGLTFSQHCNDDYLPKGYWIGFDTAHCDDLSPMSLILYPELVSGTYKDIEFVTKEVEKLVNQLKQPLQ